MPTAPVHAVEYPPISGNPTRQLCMAIRKMTSAIEHRLVMSLFIDYLRSAAEESTISALGKGSLWVTGSL